METLGTKLVKCFFSVPVFHRGLWKTRPKKRCFAPKNTLKLDAKALSFIHMSSFPQAPVEILWKTGPYLVRHANHPGSPRDDERRDKRLITCIELCSSKRSPRKPAEPAVIWRGYQTSVHPVNICENRFTV